MTHLNTPTPLPGANDFGVESPTYTKSIEFRSQIEAIGCLATLMSYETDCVWMPIHIYI